MDALASLVLIIYLATFAVGIWLPKLPDRRRLELLALSCLPTGFIALHYLRLVEQAPFYYSLRSLPYMELSSGMLGLGVGIVARELHTRKKRMLVAVTVPAMAVVALLPCVKNMVAPLDMTSLHDRWDGPYCLQSTGYTCGPACLATFLSLAGKKESERQLAKECMSTASGTEVWYLARYAREKGLKVGFHQLSGNELQGKRGIIGVKLGTGVTTGHFLALLACDGKTVDFVDPMTGHNAMPLEAFLKAYTYTGFLMSME